MDLELRPSGGGKQRLHFVAPSRVLISTGAGNSRGNDLEVNLFELSEARPINHAVPNDKLVNGMTSPPSALDPEQTRVEPCYNLARRLNVD